MPILIVCVVALVLRALGVAAEGHSVERLRVSSDLSREFAGCACVDTSRSAVKRPVPLWIRPDPLEPPQ